jgi:hypothetical protein
VLPATLYQGARFMQCHCLLAIAHREASDSGATVAPWSRMNLRGLLLPDDQQAAAMSRLSMTDLLLDASPLRN